MKRALLVVLAVLVVAVGGGWLYLDRIAQAAVERGGTRALGVPVELDSMALAPFSGRLGMDGFRVANPEGFSSESLFRIDRGRVAVRPTSLFGDVIEVPEIMLDGLHVRVERNAGDTNLKRILDNLGAPGGDGGSAPSGGAEAGGDGPRVRVGYLRIAGAGASVDLGPEFGERGRFALELPPIELRDIGIDGNGISIEQLVARVTRAVIARIEASGARELPDRIRRELRQRVEREQRAVAQELEGAVEEKKRELEDRLGNEARKLLDR